VLFAALYSGLRLILDLIELRGREAGALQAEVLVSQRQLEEVLGEYVRHYNQERPHRSRDLRPAGKSLAALGPWCCQIPIAAGWPHQ
jgi:hypothetical protein